MDDIDFDELDKAVNAMKKTPRPAKMRDPSPAEESPYDVVDRQSSMPSSRPLSPPRPRSSGGMVSDIIAPRTQSSRPAAPTPPRQQEATQQASADRMRVGKGSPIMDITPKTQRTSRIAPALTPLSETEKEPLLLEDPEQDEILLPAQTEEVPSTNLSLAEEKLDEYDEPKEEEEAKKQPVSPPVSPFIPEAKVEKRPLGAFSGYTATVEKEPVEVKLKKEEPREVTNETPDAVEDEQEVASSAEGPKPETTYGLPPESKGREVESERPIFDTKVYHQPLVVPEAHKKHSGMGMKILTFLLIVLLIAAGYALYVILRRQTS